MKALWLCNKSLFAGAFIGAVIALAAYSPALEAAKRAHMATETVSAPERAMYADLKLEESPVRMLRWQDWGDRGNLASPGIQIIRPANHTHFWYGDAIPITLAANARDGNHNPIADTAIVWRDSLDGTLGTGATLQHIFLSGGTYAQHEITVTAATEDGKSVSDSITVEIGFTQ